MRHFSGEFDGFRPLMADELSQIAGGNGEDTDADGQAGQAYHGMILNPSNYSTIWGQVGFVSSSPLNITHYGSYSAVSSSAGMYVRDVSDQYSYMPPNASFIVWN